MRKMFVRSVAVYGCLLIGTPALAQRPSLRGSPAAIARKAKQAELHDFSHLSNGARILNFFRGGLLVELKGDKNYRLDGVSYPLVRREVRLFVERLSLQSRTVCIDGLVVTSATRPIDEQPSNASKRSVHPTGMAVDFRVPDIKACRVWLERTLLSLEGEKVLEATRERRPPHYDVAVFPNPYKKYVDSLKSATKLVAKKKAPAKHAPARRKK